MNASLLGPNVKPAAVTVKKGGNGIVIGATVILIIVLCVVIYWFWFRNPSTTVQVVDVSVPTPTPASTQGVTQGPPPVQPPLTIPAATQPPVQPPPPPLQGPPPVQPQMTIPSAAGTPTPMSMTPTPVQSSTTTPGGVTCAAPNPSNIPNGTYKGKCCNCGMGIDPGVGYDPTALTCDCQTPFNTIQHTTKGIAFCAGKDIYVDQNGRLNC
jgi:hypothetical protein